MGERYGNLLTNGLSGAQHVFYEELSNYRNFQRLRVYGGDDCSRSEAGTSFEDMSKPSEVSYARSVTQVKRDEDLVRRLKRALVQPSLPSVRLGRRGDDPSPADYERMWAARAMSIQRRGDVRTQRRRERKRLVHEVRRAKDGVPQTKKHKARPPDPELYRRLKRQLDGWPEDRDPDDEEEEEADSEGVEEPSYEDNEVPNPRQPTARGVIQQRPQQRRVIQQRPQQRRQQKKKTKTKTTITTKSRKQKKKTTTETNASAPAAANAPEPAGEMHVDLTGDTEKDIYYAEEPEGALPEGALYTPAGVGPFTRERLIEAWRQHRVQSYTLVCWPPGLDEWARLDSEPVFARFGSQFVPQSAPDIYYTDADGTDADGNCITIGPVTTTRLIDAWKHYVVTPTTSVWWPTMVPINATDQLEGWVRLDSETACGRFGTQFSDNEHDNDMDQNNEWANINQINNDNYKDIIGDDDDDDDEGEEEEEGDEDKNGIEQQQQQLVPAMPAVPAAPAAPAVPAVPVHEPLDDQEIGRHLSMMRRIAAIREPSQGGYGVATATQPGGMDMMRLSFGEASATAQQQGAAAEPNDTTSKDNGNEPESPATTEAEKGDSIEPTAGGYGVQTYESRALPAATQYSLNQAPDGWATTYNDTAEMQKHSHILSHLLTYIARAGTSTTGATDGSVQQSGEDFGRSLDSGDGKATMAKETMAKTATQKQEVTANNTESSRLAQPNDDRVVLAAGRDDSERGERPETRSSLHTDEPFSGTQTRTASDRPFAVDSKQDPEHHQSIDDRLMNESDGREMTSTAGINELLLPHYEGKPTGRDAKAEEETRPTSGDPSKSTVSPSKTGGEQPVISLPTTTLPELAISGVLDSAPKSTVVSTSHQE